jgi:Flp pilus assembly pilin Flp
MINRGSLEYALVLIIAPILAIALVTTLGQQMANVFSRVTIGLTGT